MRIALITEAGYPYHSGSGSGWCHRLVTGLAGYDYHVVALTGRPGWEVPAYRRPRNVSGVSLVPAGCYPGAPTRVGGPPGERPAGRRRSRRVATGAAEQLCRGLLGDRPEHARRFRDGLVTLAWSAAGGADPLAGVPLPRILADAWRSADRAPGRLGRRDARSAAVLLAHALRALAAQVPAVDLCHTVSGGLPLLVALAARWRSNIPYLLTEQGIYLRERYLDPGVRWPGPVREVLLRFFRALSRLGYAEAAAVAAATRFDQRWQLRHGAHPAKVVVVPGGIDPAAFPARPEPEPATHPTVLWLGRIEPLQDLHTLLRGFDRVYRARPDARLRLVGPAADPAYAESCGALVRGLGLASVVSFAGPARSPAAEYAAAQVVVHSGISETTPDSVLEAMMTGRATVSTEVGGVAELVGDTGLLVPPGDPAALAGAVVGLLADPQHRRDLGSAAARRARAQFTLDRVLRAYQQLYQDSILDSGRSPHRGPHRGPPGGPRQEGAASAGRQLVGAGGGRR